MQVELEQLVAQVDIAQRMHVSNRAVNNWTVRFNDFPKPIVRFGNTPVYYWPDVVQWHIATFGQKRHAELVNAT
jgi:hypothetical protein